ncbi:MAG: chorismate synthase [Planctomycetota bacterium]|nr:chorismate synthase [Planctomycetota bacterium]MCX8040279.1 chorismate synthase [Planctomycetota bacterium]MDW8372426.1 chorismate synthase [Planctomycetota bacterium]
MPGNTFGEAFRVTTFGESHGPAVGCVIDGCPPGFPLDLAAVQRQLARRRPGQSRLVSARDEEDRVEVLSGLERESGRTLGTPLAMLVRNEDQRPSAYREWKDAYRPSHADYTYEAKYGIRAWEGGGRASARETVGRVLAGAVAEQLLVARFPGLAIVAWVERVQAIDAAAAIDPAQLTREAVDAHPTRCPSPEHAAQIEQAILAAKSAGDSLGGCVRLQVRGLPPGLGEPVFDKLDALLAQAMLSLPACKAVEVGSGFAGVALSGSAHNDPFAWEGGAVVTRSNRSGGIQGGISNGMPIELRLAFKPTATVLQPQRTIDREGNERELQARGRHDPCVLPRAVPIVEAMAALVLADCWLRQRGQVGDPWPGLATWRPPA